LDIIRLIHYRDLSCGINYRWSITNHTAQECIRGHVYPEDLYTGHCGYLFWWWWLALNPIKGLESRALPLLGGHIGKGLFCLPLIANITDFRGKPTHVA
jgi:hypothetical protein